MIRYTDSGHLYESIVPDNIKWLGVTTVVSCLKEPFLREEKAKSCSIKKPGRFANKWYGISPEEILQIWDNENKRATDLGHWYHDKCEKDLWSKGIVDGLPVIRSEMMNGIKEAPDQKLTNAIYPEHLIYLRSAGVCGQSDIVEVKNNVVTIRDFKTSKEITTEGFTNWEGITKMMLHPVSHLQDCHLNHYSLQLSIYMYMILRHNPILIPGKMFIDHIKFVESGRDKYDYPITYLHEGEPVVESIKVIEVPYLQKEVQTLFTWLKVPENRNRITKH